MQELVPYLYLDKSTDPGGVVSYILRIAICYPDGKDIERETNFVELDLTSNPFEFHIYKFSYRVVDAPPEGPLSQLIPNIFEDSIDLTNLLPTLQDNQGNSLSLIKGDKVIRAAGYQVPSPQGGFDTKHFPLEFIKDRISVLLIDTESGQDFIRSLSAMTDFADNVVTGPGEGTGSDGRGGGHPFI